MNRTVLEEAKKNKNRSELMMMVELEMGEELNNDKEVKLRELNRTVLEVIDLTSISLI